jgi:hypothetical protein
MIRRPKPNELDKLYELHKEMDSQFSFPRIDLLSSLYVVTDSDDNILGFGAIQPIFEAILVLDQNQDIFTRVAALDELLTMAKTELGEQGITEVHAFVQDKKFENHLKSRHNFKPTKGVALVKEVKVD